MFQCKYLKTQSPWRIVTELVISLMIDSAAIDSAECEHEKRVQDCERSAYLSGYGNTTFQYCRKGTFSNSDSNFAWDFTVVAISGYLDEQTPGCAASRNRKNYGNLVTV